MTLLSKSCENAIRAAVVLAGKSEDSDRKYIPVQEIAAELNLSSHFLSKILLRLTGAGILASFRGPRGGVALAQPATTINLADVVAAIDGNELFERCVLGLPQCSDHSPCPVHQQWKQRREALQSMFERSTLAGLARDKRQFDFKRNEYPL